MSSINLSFDRKRISNTFLEENTILVIIGATGRVGSLLTSIFLSRGCKVILVVRDSSKIETVVEEHLLNRILEIKQIDLNSDMTNNNEEDFVNMFKENNKYIIINAMEIRHKNKNDLGYCKLLKGHYNLYKMLDKVKSIEKVILISNNLTNYSFCLYSFYLNLRYGLILHFKKKSEDLLKSFNFNYLIFKPGKILTFQKETNVNERILEKVYVSQNTKMLDTSITDASLSRFIFDSMFDKSIPARCSIHCYSHRGIKDYDKYMKLLQNKEIEDYFDNNSNNKISFYFKISIVKFFC